MRNVERELKRAVRRLAEERDGFTGQVVLHCANDRLQHFEVNERHKANQENERLMEGA